MHKLSINVFYIYFNICFLHRTTQKEKAQREAAENARQSANPPAQQLPAGNPAVATPDNDSKENDNLTTPPSQVHPRWSATPTLSTPINRARGQPHKDLQPLSTDDKPTSGSKAEILHWQKKYKTAKWRYDKLTSDDAKTYRQSENERVKRKRHTEHEEIIAAGQGQSEVYEHVPKMPRSKTKDKSRLR